MFRYARVRLGDADAAEEAVQEALLAAVGDPNAFEGRSSERTWLIGILRHKVLDAIRRRSTDRRLLSGSGELSAEPAAPDRSPTDEDLRSGLARVIGELPDAMRVSLILREMDGLPSEVVAEILGTTPTNVWTLVHRAKKRLRTELGPMLEMEAGS